MGAKTGIQWTDATWTPIRARNLKTGKVGWHCEHVSPGCANCYAEKKVNLPFGTGLPFKPGHRKDIEVFISEKLLLAPFSWRKPKMIFVCSMTDLFADFVPEEMIDRVFSVMAIAEHHTFQVLTKRPERMRGYVTTVLPKLKFKWPLPNVWLGVSVENQEYAEQRVPELLATPAALRFLSCEPLLGGIDLMMLRNTLNFGEGQKWLNALGGYVFEDGDVCSIGAKIGWVIAGGESGHSKADIRPMHSNWPRIIRQDCETNGVPFHFKQWGSWRPVEGLEVGTHGVSLHGTVATAAELMGGEVGGPECIKYNIIRNFGNDAGRLLDGHEYNGTPNVGSLL